jgi:hypothetical protein
MKENLVRKWTELERLFAQLERKMPESFTPKEQEEVMSYVHANEFGLAFETFNDICIEEKKAISQEVRTLLTQIASIMNASV